MIRKYSIRLTNNGRVIFDAKYKDFWSCCYKMGEILRQMNLLDELDNIYFPETEFMGEKYKKRVAVSVEVPDMTITIAKLTTGDMNQDLAKKTIKEIKEIHERTNNQLRNKH